jgi:hypothetical protein
LVERGPEKAGVGGSIPSLATILFNNLERQAERLAAAEKKGWRRSFDPPIACL